MPWVGAGSGRGTGFTLGPAQNTFGDLTTANRAAAEALRDTYAMANAVWLAVYNDERSNFIQLIWNGGDVLQRRNVAGNAWEDGTNVLIGRPGPAGRDGAPGGGAWDSLGMVQEIGATRGANIFIGAGITMPTGRSVFGYRLGGSVADFNAQAGIMVVSAALLDGRDSADSGDTSDAANRVRLPEFGGGGLITGSIYGGLTSARELLIATSNADQNFAIEVFDYVPSAVQGRRTDSEIDTLIAGYTGAIPGLTIPDAQLPASIMRDNEFTAAAVRGLLSLTQAELDSLLVGEGANITSGVLNIPQNDGTTLSLTLPTGGGGMPDGVINSLTIVGNVLTAQTTTGGSVELDLSTYLDARFLNQGSNLSDVPDVSVARTNLEVLDQAGVRTEATDSFSLVTALPAIVFDGKKVLFRAAATGLTDAVDQNGNVLTTASVGDLFEYDLANTRWQFIFNIVSGGGMPPMPHALTRYAFLRADGAMPSDFTEDNFLSAAATSSTTQDITTPASNDDMVVGVAVPVSEGPLTGVAELTQDGDVNQFAMMIRGNFLPAVGDPEVELEIDGVNHYVYCTSAIVRGVFLGVIGYRLTQTPP